ncbi:hypothetical protein [Nocardia wallacei]|uniref:Uncharacterized protein n=1 Tax=Nocardia wallacei TaxID=480035 RepID=A0A7G1KR77_9NOCA|nr:hypothetical protein [Nocardia wallacei]BCK57371.1 hypothetical protein NWFMUON74_51430 [Nocardia wallacei]
MSRRTADPDTWIAALEDEGIGQFGRIVWSVAAGGGCRCPWPINSWVYWWQNGTLDLAAITRSSEDGVTIRPTPRFIDYLDVLARTDPSTGNS